MSRYTQIGAVVDDTFKTNSAWLSDKLKGPAKRWIRNSPSRCVAFTFAFLLSIWLFVSVLQLKPSPSIIIPGLQPHPTSPPELWAARAEEVKNAFRHAYSGYHKHALMHDELRPVSGGYYDRWNGWSVSVVDALDTMWLMELYDDFKAAIPVIAKMPFTSPEGNGPFANFFETVIRHLGGLLSAYALSGEAIFLSRAEELGDRLLPAFNSPSGLPWFEVNVATGETRAGWTNSVLWSEATSCQMEYKYLAHLTGRTKYYERVEKVMVLMQQASLPDGLGLLPTAWDIVTGKPSNVQYSVGARADSAHEYMLKQWLLTGRSESRGKDLYQASANGIIKNMLYLSPTRNLLYVTDIDNGKPSHVFEHLSCFLPGLFTLATQTLPLAPRDKELHQWAALGLAKTCWTTYADQATGLGPDEMVMKKWEGDDPHVGRWYEKFELWEQQGRVGLPPGLQDVSPVGPEHRDYTAQNRAYQLRPELVESFYMLWKATRDEIWRERGWLIFKALQTHSRTQYGYAILENVDQVPSPHRDEMPSYFLAETLKYLYLLFADPDIISLDKYVLNTEAHPLPIFNWSSWEKQEHDSLFRRFDNDTLEDA